MGFIEFFQLIRVKPYAAAGGTYNDQYSFDFNFFKRFMLPWAVYSEPPWFYFYIYNQANLQPGYGMSIYNAFMTCQEDCLALSVDRRKKKMHIK